MRLKLAEKVSDTLFVVMRVYFEKPRPQWAEGLINDPYMNDSFKITDGLHIGQIYRDILEIGLPTATRHKNLFHHSIYESYCLVCNRRTHYRIANPPRNSIWSLISIGFKNGTDGGLTVAINALQSVANPHSF